MYSVFEHIAWYSPFYLFSIYFSRHTDISKGEIKNI